MKGVFLFLLKEFSTGARDYPDLPWPIELFASAVFLWIIYILLRNRKRSNKKDEREDRKE
jgi:hypothetical protein